MREQGTLFDMGEPEPIGHHGYPITRKSDPETSKEAAETLNMTRYREMFLKGLGNCHRPSTAKEIASEFKGETIRETIRKRAKELVDAGLVKTCESRKCLVTKKTVTTYKLTEKGRNEYERLQSN